MNNRVRDVSWVFWADQYIQWNESKKLSPCLIGTEKSLSPDGLVM